MNILLIIILSLLLGAVLALSIRYQWWRLPKRGLVALMYHHVAKVPAQDEQFPFTVSPAQLEQHILLLQKKGFTPITFSQMQQALQSGQKQPSRPVMLTFDDGYADNYVSLFPLLKQYQFKANIFLTTNKIGADPLYLTWPQVQEMQASGLVEFGSHTLTHRRLRSLSDDEIWTEIKDSKTVLEQQLLRPVNAFCYPYGAGAFDKRVRPVVFKAGYLLDFSTRKGINPWPWNPKKSILRAFPRGGDTLTDFYFQITRGKSKF